MDLELSLRLKLAAQAFLRELDATAGETNQSFDNMRNGARAAANDIGAAYRTLGLQSADEIRTQIERVEAAYQTLAKSGTLSANEQIRAARQATAAVGDLNRQLSTDNLAGAYRTIAIRSFQDIRAEISRTQSAFYTLAGSGKLSAEELGRAAEAAEAKVAALQREMHGTAFDDAFATIGIRSFASLQAEISKTRAAYTELANSGRLTGAELARAAVAAEEKIGELNRELQGDKTAEAYRTLGVRAFSDIRAEIERTQTAYRTLQRTGQLSAEEQARAVAAVRDRVVTLKRELAGAGNEEAYQVIGVRSLAAIRAELAQTQAAYSRLATSANLSGAELTRTASAARQRIRELNAEMAGSAASAQGGVANWSNLGQTLLATAAAYMTFQGALQAARASIEGALTLDRINIGLTAVLGNSERAAAEFGFVRAEADRLGLNLASAAREYTKLAAATRGTALEGQKTREIFTAVSEAAAVLGLSADEASGALLAIQQMVSKGTVSAEELRGQLGERLPGAFQIAARALNTTTQGLSQMLEQGAVASDVFLPKFAAELRRTFQDGLPSAVGSARAEFARLQNTVFETAASVGQSGLNERLAEAARLLSDKLADPVVQQALRNTGIVIGDIAVAAAKLSGELLSIAKILGAGLIAAKLTSGLSASGKAAAEAGREISKLQAGAMALSRLNVYVTVGLVGIEAVRAGTKLIADYAFEHRKLSEQEQRRAADLRQQIPAVEASIAAQQRYANVQVKTAQDVARLNPQQLTAYKEQLQAKKSLEAAQLGLSMRTEELLGYQLQEEKSGRNNAGIVKLLSDQKTEAAQQTKRWSTAIQDTNAALQDLDSATQGTATTVDSAILPAVNRLIAAYDAQIAKSPEVATALGKVFEGFNPNNLTSVQTAITALHELGATGKASATQIRTAVEKELSGLPLDGLQRLQTVASAAFGTTGADAQRLAIVLDTTLKTALDKLGLTVEGAQTGLSKQFSEAEAAFNLLASNVQAKAPQIRAATEKLIDGAKTAQELKAVQANLQELADRGVMAGDAMAASFARLNNRLREFSDNSVQAAKDQTSIAQAQADVGRANNDVIRAAVVLQREGTVVAQAAYEAAVAEAKAQEDAARAVQAQVAARDAARRAQVDNTDSARLVAEQAQSAADEAQRLAENSRQAAIGAKSLSEYWSTVSDAARDAADSSRNAGREAAGAASTVGGVGGGVAAIINDIRSEVNSLGDDASRRFAQMTGMFQGPTTAAEKLGTQLQSARLELSQLERQRPIGDAVGLSTRLNSLATAAARVKVETLEGRQNLQQLERQTVSSARNVNQLQAAFSAFSESVQASTRDAVSSASGLIGSAAGIHEELLRMQGKEDEIEKRRYERRLQDLELEYKLARAKQATALAQASTEADRSAIAKASSELETSYQTARSDLSKIQRQTVANQAKEAADRQRQQAQQAQQEAEQRRRDIADQAEVSRAQASNQVTPMLDNLVRSITANDVAGTARAQGNGEPERRVRIELVSGNRTIPLDIDASDENSFIRALQDAQGRAA